MILQCLYCGTDTHERTCSRSTLLQHPPGAKVPRLHQRFLAKKMRCATELLLPSFPRSYQTGFISGSKLQGQICCTSLFQEQAPWCVLKFACREMTCIQLANQIGLFFSSTTHCEINRVVPSFSSLVVSFVCTGLGTYPGACFRSKLPRV